MNLLIVAATSNEIMPLLEHYHITPINGFIKTANGTPDFLITGVGAIATTYHLTKVLCANTYDLIINFGICGAFARDVSVGTTLLIKRDCLADIGAEDGDDFLLLTQMNVYSDSIGWIYPTSTVNIDIPTASAITVNTVTGNDKSKEKWKTIYNPDVESMEGAAFFYTCHKENAPCIQIRTISNYVGYRKNAEWDIQIALEQLNKVALTLLKTL